MHHMPYIYYLRWQLYQDSIERSHSFLADDRYFPLLNSLAGILYLYLYVMLLRHIQELVCNLLNMLRKQLQVHLMQ